MCKAMYILKALKIFHASFPPNHGSEYKAYTLPWSLGFSFAKVDVRSRAGLYWCMLLAVCLRHFLVWLHKYRTLKRVGPHPILASSRALEPQRVWTPHNRIWLDFELLSPTSLRDPCCSILLPTHTGLAVWPQSSGDLGLFWKEYSCVQRFGGD
jgi:hypothetical protein